jgi:hypothetical protein
MVSSMSVHIHIAIQKIKWMSNSIKMKRKIGGSAEKGTSGISDNVTKSRSNWLH